MNHRKLNLLLSLGLAPLAQAQSSSETVAPAPASEPVAPVVAAPAEAAPTAEVTASDPAAAPAAPAADAPPADYAMPKEEVALPGAEAPKVAAPAAVKEETISVDFPQEDVRSIIRNVADLYELNVVIPDTLVGSISIKLRDVTWKQVFNVVLEPLRYTWVQEGNIIKIKSMDELQAEPTATRVYVINFARAEDILASIAPLIDASKGGRIQVDKRSNSLVITERPSQMNNIQAIVERLDRPTDQVMIESKFVEVTDRNSKDLGIEWSSLNGYEVSAGPFERQTEKAVGRTSDRSDNLTSTSPYSFTEDTANTFSRSRLDTAVFSAESFNAIITAIETKNKVELVSNPTVVTLNNTPASINIGEEYPIPSYTYNDQRGTFEVSGFEYKKTGIILNVTPQINSAGFINLNVTPEISSRTGDVNFGGAAGATIPILTVRKTQSTVTIKSGYTLALGGLIEKQNGTRNSKIPFLGDIPLLGRLFNTDSNNQNNRNLIVFITAKVLNADGSTYKDVFSARTLYEMGIKERDVPGYEPPASEKALFEDIQKSQSALEQMESEAKLRGQVDSLNQAQMKEIDRQTDTSSKKSTPKRKFQ